MCVCVWEGGGRVHHAPIADGGVGVTVHVKVELVLVVGNESHGKANITDVPVTVIDPLGVRGLYLKHVTRAVARLRVKN